MNNTNTNAALINKSFALNRHRAGWGMVRVIRTEGTLVWVSDPQRGEYPALPKDLKWPSSLTNRQREELKNSLSA